MNKKRLQLKINGLREIKNVMESMNIDYYLGGNALIGIFRNGLILPIETGIAISLKYEDYILYCKGLVKNLVAAKFEIRMNNNKEGLKEKIKARKNNFLYEIAPWYSGEGMRIRAKYNLPEKFFTPGSRVEMQKESYQTFNTPEEYLIFRFGENWKTPIVSDKRKDYENGRYYRKLK